MRYDCGVELHSLVTTEDTAFISFHYVYLYLTFVYNLSARHTEQYISLYLSQELPNTIDCDPARRKSWNPTQRRSKRSANH